MRQKEKEPTPLYVALYTPSANVPLAMLRFAAVTAAGQVTRQGCVCGVSLSGSDLPKHCSFVGRCLRVKGRRREIKKKKKRERERERLPSRIPNQVGNWHEEMDIFSCKKYEDPFELLDGIHNGQRYKVSQSLDREKDAVLGRGLTVWGRRETRRRESVKVERLPPQGLIWGRWG